ncbi:MAG: GIY-YIG nuclease family protein [Bacteroidota bacterium]
MFLIYILRSLLNGKFYVGYTDDIQRRLVEHNAGMSKYTRSGRPWELAYTESYATRSEAMRREKEIKSRKSRKYILSLIQEAKIGLGERPVP